MSSSRRGVGLSAFSNAAINSAYTNHGTSLRTAHSESLKTQLSVFQQLLHQWSITHAKEIRSNPTFRAEFARMCNLIGVDPLASSQASKDGKGGLLAQMLGESVRDFSFELGVRIVEVCRGTRAENGGLMGVEEVRALLKLGRGVGGGMDVTADEIKKSVKSLEPLGSGFTIMELGSVQMIRSVPKELNTDQSTVLEAVQVMGHVTVSMLQINLNWEKARAKAVLEDLVADSLVWVDLQAREMEYWTPSFIHHSTPSVGTIATMP